MTTLADLGDTVATITALAGRITDRTTAASITVPATIEGTIAELNGVGALITAKRWQRAALVAAYVRLDATTARRGRSSSSGHDLEWTAGRFSCREFAELGIHGLSSATTVSRYLQAWNTVVGTTPRPGQTVTLPECEFPASTPTVRHERTSRCRPPRQHDAVLAALRKYRTELTDPELRHLLAENCDETNRERIVETADEIARAMALLAATVSETGEESDDASSF